MFDYSTFHRLFWQGRQLWILRRELKVERTAGYQRHNAAPGHSYLHRFRDEHLRRDELRNPRRAHYKLVVSKVVCFKTIVGGPPGCPPLWHGLSPGDMALELKGFRRVAVAIPVFAIAVSSPRARASNARSRSSQISRITRPSSAGAAANRSIAASASTRSPSAPPSSNVSTRTPVAGIPHASRCPSPNRWSTAERISGIAPSRSPS